MSDCLGDIEGVECRTELNIKDLGPLILCEIGGFFYPSNRTRIRMQIHINTALDGVKDIGSKLIAKKHD